MIVITGATGPLNGTTTDRLLDRLPTGEVAVAVRDPAKAQRFTDRSVEVRRCDYADPASLPAAFEGADQLLLVSSNDPGADAVGLHATAIEAAVAAGVGRILYTSHQGAALDSPFIPARGHAATEQLLADSGVAWTALRNGFYAHSLDMLMGPWRETGTVVVPADGPVSWTAREDAAEAAAVVLADGSAVDGPMTLTASAAPTFADVVGIASTVIGRPVDLQVVDPEEWVAAQVEAGRPELLARFTLGIFLAAHEGFFAGTDPQLATILGREPRTVADVLADAPR
ncbi:NAD(P)H-binding protein [Aeromicrobium sp. CFBP 8757]|uniref:NAD(P)H-binding protein n=1 Tax=Aeromicrobium sp. CFBP 8757 TaxID=2775288 RepID=UPI0017870172|nr:NAD(P)H-binding protein [Aeromicrobium sp. CFBP 8757]MBD8608662.1 NAD(P)H-binding protein [Aeromicrobium sp. CFBP 8757]